MKRVEIIANRSAQEEILDSLESAIPDFFYTLVPVVRGRGRQKRRMGTPTWPEENFLLIAYVKDEIEPTIREVIAGVKVRFPTDGIKLFFLSEED
jgi:nitrogen regulatory protein PII